MSASDVIGWVVTYVMAGALVGVMALPACDVLRERGKLVLRGPETAAIMFLCGLLWPITGPIMTLWFLVSAGRVVSRGLVQLWRRWRAHRAAKKIAYETMRRARRVASGKSNLPKACIVVEKERALR